MIKRRREKLTTGWREWCGLPELDIPLIKAKIDTGAATSALHATKVREFEKDGKRYLRFVVQPLQKSNKVKRECEAELIDKREVKSSNGHITERYVIRTRLTIGKRTELVDITLTKRDLMAYRMLVGRQALRAMQLAVDPSHSFNFGRISDKESKKLYHV